jgi:tetratricopeptide (TPR) repeat protein
LETASTGPAKPLLEQAIKHQRIALELKPRDPSLLTTLCQLYRNLALVLETLDAPIADRDAAHQLAIETARQLWEQAPDSADAQSGLGAALHTWASALKDRGDLPAARKLLDEAIGYQEGAYRLNPRNMTYREFVHNTLQIQAETLQRLGEPDKAEVAWRRAAEMLEDLIQHLPGSTKYAEDLASTYVKLSDLCSEPAAQAELVRKALALTPDKDERWTWLGVIHCNANDWNAAIVALEKAEELYPESTETCRFHLAIAHAFLGHGEEAQAWYKRAVDWLELHRLELQQQPSRLEAAQQMQATAQEALKLGDALNRPNAEKP